MSAHKPPLFELGQIVATPRAMNALSEANEPPIALVRRHETGDWGDLYQEDKEANELSVREGSRILSSYILSTGVEVWIITEADRSITTLLLPDEY